MSVSAMFDFIKTLFAPADEPGRDPDDERTACFFVEPSWLSGAASIGNIWGDVHRYALGLPDEEADRRALHSDWRMTGQDVRNAMVLIACYELPNHLAGSCALSQGLRRYRASFVHEANGNGNGNGVHEVNGKPVAPNGVSRNGHHQPNGAYRAANGSGQSGPEQPYDVHLKISCEQQSYPVAYDPHEFLRSE